MAPNFVSSETLLGCLVVRQGYFGWVATHHLASEASVLDFVDSLVVNNLFIPFC